ncbi:Hypothetical protein (Fragment) [Durusdinium trenchii]|uniref:EF-hand domain-containing protein n=1 Tax=Durusdinium trenchii TaxID=1381693 RepID=A0ABP0LIX4_9DINO
MGVASKLRHVAELSTDLEDLRQRLREVTFATSDLLSPPEAVVRERIRLEYEEQLRQQKLKVQKSEEEAQELRKTNEKLQVQVEQHVRNQVDLTRQVGESRHLDSPAAVPGMEEVANRLAQRNEDLAEENAQLLKDVEDLKRAHAEEMKRQTDLGQGELQAKRAQAVEMVKSRAPRLEGAPWNPLRELRELVIQKEERGEEGALRGMVKGFDHERSSLMSWPMFKALLRDQVGLDALNEEKMEFAEYIFQALDDDGDGIVPYPDFEKAILGDARGPLTELLLQLAQALRTANLRLHQLVRMHDEMNDGELGREELMQIFLRINLRLRDLDLDRLMAEFDCGRRSISVAELQFRVEAARVEEIMGELKVQLARYGAGALQQTFADADEDYSGRLSFSQLEGVLLHELKLPMSREVLQELFDLFNTDQTGQISYRELLNRCGLAQSQASLQWIHEILPPADRPRWLEQTLCAVKRALLMALREEERFGDGAKRLLGDFDERKAGALSLAQLRRALKSLGLSAGQREARRNTTRDETGERRGDGKGFGDEIV